MLPSHPAVVTQEAGRSRVCQESLSPALQSLLEDAECSGNDAARDAKLTWGSLEMWDLLNSIANKAVCSTHSQGMGFCNPHLTGIPADVLLTTPRRSSIQMKGVAQAQHLVLFPHKAYYTQGSDLRFKILQHSQIYAFYPLEAFLLLILKITSINPPL